jgi:VWFA-related protein
MTLKSHACLVILVFAITPSFAWQSAVGSNTADAGSKTESVQTPVFKAKTEVVDVPVVVRDKKGQPVTGLKQDAFQLEENGRARQISSFEEITPETAKPLAAAQDGYSNIPLDASLHTHLTIAVLDLINTNELQRTDGKEQLIRFFSKEMPKGEPVSLLCLTKNGVKMVHPFTSDPSLLVKALQDFKVESVTLGYKRDVMLETLKQIREIAKAYQGVPGRKSMVLYAGYWIYSESPGSAYGDIRSDYEDTWASLLTANIAVYPIGLLAAATDLALNTQAVNTREQTLRYFADRTGGKLCHEDNGADHCLSNAIEDSRSYYLLSYNLPQDDRKPGWRKLKVKVNEKSVEVRAREGFYYEPEGSDPKKQAKPHEDEINALASPLASSTIPMNVRVLPPSASGSGGKVTQQFQITVPMSGITIDASLNPALNLEVGAIALSDKIKDAGEFLHPIKGNPKPETLKQFEQSGISWNEKLDLSPGTYDMRFFVRDNPTGKIGTVVFPLEVK